MPRFGGRLVIGLLITLTVGVVARATIVPSLNLSELVENADLVAVGQVSKITREGHTVTLSGVAAFSVKAELVVEKVAKGEAGGPRITFDFLSPQAPVGYGGIAAGQFGVFFLRHAQSGYEILDPYHPFVVAFPGAPRAEGKILDQVIGEVAYALKASAAPVQVRLEAVRVLETAYDAASTAALKGAARDPNDSVRIGAMAALLARNDISFLAPAADLMLQPSQRRGADPSLVERLAYAMRFGLKDPRSIPTLGGLLRADNVLVRRAAANALRNTRDRAAVQPLITALGDSDREVRYSAVAGLGEITGQDEWTPSIDYFNQNEQKFIVHWREWAETNQ